MSEEKYVSSLRRIGYLLLCLFFFLSLWHYSLLNDDPEAVSVQEFLDNPSPSFRREGRTIQGIYKESFPGGFYLEYNQQRVPIFTPERTEPPRYGEIVVYGTFNPDGSITAQATHAYAFNYFFYVVSAAAGMFVLYVLFREWKLTPSGLQERKPQQRTQEQYHHQEERKSREKKNA